VLAVPAVGPKRALFITIGESPRPDILDEMRPWWPRWPRGPRENASSLDIEERGALDGLSREEIARARPGETDERLVSRLRDGTEVLLEAEWVHHRVERIVRDLDDGGIDLFVLLCTGRFQGLAPRGILVAAGPIVDHGLAALAESAPSIGVLLPDEGQKAGFRCEPAAGHRFLLSHASPYSGDRWEQAARELEDADLVVMHCMGYTEPMRRKLAEKTGKPVLLARRMVAAAVAQVL
jgi:protein AroM